MELPFDYYWIGCSIKSGKGVRCGADFTVKDGKITKLNDTKAEMLHDIYQLQVQDEVFEKFIRKPVAVAGAPAAKLKAVREGQG